MGGTGEEAMVMNKVKRKTAIPLDESRPTKPVAPSTVGRAHRGEPYVLESPERGPRKTDTVPEAVRDSRGDRLKPPVTRDATRPPRSKRATAVEMGDQRPKGEEGSQTTGRKEQYIRMRIRVSEGQLSVVDSHLVDGPLSQPSGFAGGNVYEVTLGDRLLHAGHLPDLGVQRSFVNPDPKAPREQKGHHLTERSVYEFTARVPASEVTPNTIGHITVRIHRVKEEARVDRLGDARLGKQFEREMRPIAELVGLPESVLPEAIERRGGRTPSV
jgi:hypothetical protein